MQQYLFSFLFSVVLSTYLTAQRGNNQVQLIAEVGIPGNDNGVGFGGFIRGLYGLNRSAQLSLMSGVVKFTLDERQETQTTLRLIPVMIGYKHYFHKFYVEPQAGYGELGGKIKSGGDAAKPSVGAFFWALGAGYRYKKMELGIRYQNSHGAEKESAGIWHNKSFSYFGLHIGYTLFE